MTSGNTISVAFTHEQRAWVNDVAQRAHCSVSAVVKHLATSTNSINDDPDGLVAVAALFKPAPYRGKWARA